MLDWIVSNWLPITGGFIGIGTLLSGLRINREWEQAIVLRLGKYKRTTKAGLFYKLPLIESAIRRDLRTQTLEINKQSVITKDNISVKIDAVAFVRIINTMKSITEIEKLYYSLSKYAQTTLRNVVGEVELDDLLAKREEIAEKIRDIVDHLAEKWGVNIEKIELQDISMPPEMQRVMARQAEAEREKRGVIIASQGELEAAKNLKKASDELRKSKYSYSLRQLQTISDVSQDQSNTIIFAPTEALNSPILGGGISAKVPKPKD